MTATSVTDPADLVKFGEVRQLACAAAPSVLQAFWLDDELSPVGRRQRASAA